MAFSLVYNDQRYQQAVRDGDDKLVSAFYHQSYKMASSSIRQQGVEDENDISEVYQESFVIFYSNVKREDFKLTSQLSTYLIGICIRQARAFRRKAQKHTSQLPLPDEPDELTGEYEQIEESKRRIVDEEFERMKSTRTECYHLLKLAFMEGKQNATIAHILNKKSEEVIKTQKNRCLNYLRRDIFKRLYHE